VLVREATRGEVAGILGEAYLRLSGSVTGDYTARQAYLIHARDVLEFAHEAGEADPMVSYQLAVLARESGADGEAGWLQRAVDGKVPRPSAYVSLAQLRLQQLSDRAYGERISAADTATIWALLQQADTLRPRQASTYSLGLAMWQNSSIRPGQSDLLLLADGVDAFPEERTLTLDALRLFLKLGVELNPFLEPRVHAWHRRLGTPGY
jgi:hypothetical protein